MDDSFSEWIYNSTIENKQAILKGDVPTRDKIQIACSVCGSSNQIELNQLKLRIKKRGTYLCRSCAAKDGYHKTGRDRYRDAMMARYGVANPAEVPEIRAKARKTNIARYGEGGSTKIARKAFFDKHGVKNPFDLPQVVKKASKIKIERWGVENFHLGELLKRNGVATKEELAAKLVAFLEKEKVSCSDPKTEAHMHTRSCTLTRLLHYCGRDDLLFNGYFQSRAEGELHEFITEELQYKGVVIKSDRKAIGGLELDIYLPELKIAIEHHGLYWHSHNVLQNKEYHRNKRLRAEGGGIRLIQIFEDEWMFKNQLVKAMLRSLILRDNRRVFARKLQLKKVSKSETVDFLEDNHLMGKFSTGKNIGLYAGDDLLQILVYKKQRDVLDLSRLCSKRGVTVVGGLSKLLSRVRKENPNTTIQSFVDQRYADGHSLKRLGFVCVSETLGFKWVDRNRTHNRSYCRANMNGCGLSEADCAESMGLLKIYDAGQAKWTLCGTIKIQG